VPRVYNILPVPETMTVPQVAHTLGLPSRTVYSFIEAGTIPSLRVGNRILVLRDVVHAMLDQGRVMPEPVGDEAW
jgi:excisionase family DNA binding protein